MATISGVYDDAYTQQIKTRDDIILIKIDQNNRSEKYDFLEKLLGKLHKAKRYASEPERFIQDANQVRIRTDHGEKTLIKNQGGWECGCEFFVQNQICSHLIAYEAISR